MVDKVQDNVTDRAFSHNRYSLTIDGLISNISVYDLSGQAELNQPWHYQITFTSTDKAITSAQVLNKSAIISFNPEQSALLTTTLDKPYRLCGIVTQFKRVSVHQDESRYQVVIGSRLALLSYHKNSAIYQQQSVIDIVESLLRSHGYQGTDYTLSLTQHYPIREFVMQWQESDLAFIRRLMADIGVWFRFEYRIEHDRDHLVISDDIQGWHDGGTIICQAPSGMADNGQSSVWDLTLNNQIVTEQVLLNDYNYRQANQAMHININTDAINPTLAGTDYRYGEHYLELGDQYTIESGAWYAMIRHQAAISHQQLLQGVSNYYHLAPGQRIDIINHPLSDTADEWIILSVKCTGDRSHAYQVSFTAIPFDLLKPYRPQPLSRPVISGTLTARITSPDNDRYGYLDTQGRYRVKFNVDLTDWKAGEESLWLRLAKPYAGDTYGFHFPLIDGTEVAVAFNQGDPDRPYIAYALHDSAHPDHVSTINKHRNVLRTPANNKLRLHDKRGQEHIKLATEQGKTQLNLGHIVDQNKVQRGEGFELRTDLHGAIAANQGLLLTTSTPADTEQVMLAMDNIINGLENALAIAKALHNAGSHSQAHTANIDSQSALKTSITDLNQSALAAYAQAGVALTSPENIQLSAAENTTLTTENQLDISALNKITLATEQAIGLFAHKMGIKMIAARGDIQIQAQNDNMALAAQKAVNIDALDGKVTISAANNLTLVGDGSFVKINASGIDLGTEGNIVMKCVTMQKMDGNTVEYDKLPIPEYRDLNIELKQVEYLEEEEEEEEENQPTDNNEPELNDKNEQDQTSEEQENKEQENRPLPCVVILIHGVNDIGEAYENLDKGICEGLNKRLGRSDLVPNKWKVTQTEADNFSPRMTIVKEGYSPVIPFFWGYRPVDKEKYKEDQQAYYDRLENQKQQDPELPYDSYWKERDIEVISREITIKKLNCDKFGNWIDCNFQRNGGPFSDATSCIPDMYGPGMGGETTLIGKWGSSDGAKVYDNPHRIYLAYAAHRLARLIKEIRADTKGQDIPINIVAHSQGTIITMLANMLLEQDEVLPADCVILAHSPYAFDISLLEQLSKDFALGMQTKKGREQTFINFVEIMNNSQRDFRKVRFDDLNDLVCKGVIGSTNQENTKTYQTETRTIKHYDRLGNDKELFYRDNFGKVYNYFSPNDHVVSLRSVQGMGWQGIPDDILDKCQNYKLKQRIFSQHYVVGNDTKKQALIIPPVTYQIAARDYPAVISEQDYKQRGGATNYDSYSYRTKSPIYLTKPQLEALKATEFFKQLDGELLSGFYHSGEFGRSIFVLYQPSQTEYLRNNPLANYNKVTANELDETCRTVEQEYLKDDEVIQQRQIALDNLPYQQVRQITALEAASILNCQVVSTSGATTVGYHVTRTITGEAIPEPFIYKVDQPGGKSALSRSIYYNDAYNSEVLAKLNGELKYLTISKPDFIANPTSDEWQKNNGNITITDKQQLQQLVEHYAEWDRGILNAEHVRFVVPEQLLITRYLTKKELQTKMTELVELVKNESSHHSGITMNELAPKQVMAYDLAIGLIKNITSQNLTVLQKWRYYADWRNPANTDKEALTYMTTGILPESLKESMNYPHKDHMPKTVVNDFTSVTYSEEGLRMQNEELIKDKYRLLTTWPKAQYPLPEPDLKTE